MSHMDQPHRLRITLETPGGDGLDDANAIQVELSMDLRDCNVHGYFRLFEMILALEGFSERVVMGGAARLAFNEMRNVEMMRSVASEYSLVLEEDLNAHAVLAPEATA
jgi:hypothetical protein